MLCLSPVAARAEDWWLLSFGPNTGGVLALYVEKAGIADSPAGKTAWIVETFSTDRTDVALKKEHVDIDCTLPRYRGLEWVWTDRAGQVTTNDEEDLRWNTVTIDSPMQAVRDFACAGPGAGARRVQQAPAR